MILHPCRDAFVGVIRSGGFRAASFFAVTPVGPEALDHRLFSRTASGVPKNPSSEQKVGPVPLYVLRPCFVSTTHPISRAESVATLARISHTVSSRGGEEWPGCEAHDEFRDEA